MLDVSAAFAVNCRMLPDVLTLKEAAAWLRLSERALYDLARSRQVPAALLGGKWVFPRTLLERWLAARADGADVPRRLTPPPVLAGSHDPLLDWAVRQSGCGLALRTGGSLEGLEVLAAGQAVAAAVHLLDPDSGAWNAPAAREVLGVGGHVGIVWAWRDQGLLVPPGNPLGLAAVSDLVRPGLRVIGRQNRAGSHVLLVHLLNEAGLRLDQVAFLTEPARAEDEVAAAVAEGRAEAGFGIRAEARSRGLDFVPLVRERFDLVLPRREYFEPPLQALFAFARTPAFAARAGRMSGYEVGDTGAVAFNG
ncbi:helix-turn-helix transcriptional regulator [Roseomonas eburnea]|uniref:Helix-turn-helix transcriptional regulator n=1 Tax=Neoroseomonas eburnea TaxID=1346889 RepID=A0A9X9XJ21_9PROT|nr:helix-turn-helix transcriptional regulator [Neoroseomonas eburnea]MBR0683707.1 helix-turn-helix transcriptional regulator [Neoroseomonas eburnea]